MKKVLAMVFVAAVAFAAIVASLLHAAELASLIRATSTTDGQSWQAVNEVCGVTPDSRRGRETRKKKTDLLSSV